MDVDLTRYPETTYVARNKTLKELFGQLERGEVSIDTTLYSLIKEKNWHEVDAYFASNPGKEAFFALLQQLFLFKYFLPEPEQLTRKEFEIATGIQQVRWMVDDENCRVVKNDTGISRKVGPRIMNNPGFTFEVESASFIFWDDIEPHEKDKIVHQVLTGIQRKLVLPMTGEQLNDFFTKTVWYRVLHHNINTNAYIRPGSWHGYGTQYDYYPIPETFNFSSIACIYAPKLVFGSLSDQTLLRYIAKERQRPYIAHLPDSISNLCDVHGLQQSIVSGWIHDISHSRNGMCSIRDTVRYINSMCNTTATSIDEIRESLLENDSIYYRCIDANEMIARVLNDTGKVLHSSFPQIVGKQKKTRKTRKHKTRKPRVRS